MQVYLNVFQTLLHFPSFESLDISEKVEASPTFYQNKIMIRYRLFYNVVERHNYPLIGLYFWGVKNGAVILRQKWWRSSKNDA